MRLKARPGPAAQAVRRGPGRGDVPPGGDNGRAMSVPPPAPTVAAPCGNCGQPMRQVTLAGHYGRAVELDLCAPCHLIWFDQTETARLTGAGLLALIGAMAQAQSLPHTTMSAQAHCPRCHGPLKTVHNRSRWGASLQLECRDGHGAYQTFTLFLQEKGLLRAMSRLDRQQLLQQSGRIDCVNCGAAIGTEDTACPACRSVPSLLDVARLARALDPEGALAPGPVHGRRADQAALQCAACGAALPPGHALACAQCGATLAISRLAQAHDEVAALDAALRAHDRRPSAEVVQRRVQRLDADLPRRREWAAQMEAEARTTAGHDLDGWLWRVGWRAARDHPLGAALLALVLALLWWRW